MKCFQFWTWLLVSISSLAAEVIDLSQTLRISQLMPRKNFFATLAIDPALPKDFIAKNERNDLSYYDRVYWGPEKVIDTFLKGGALSEPVMFAEISQNLSQSKMYELDIEEPKRAFLEFKDIKDVQFESGKWGEYPYLKITASLFGKRIRMGYIGLNHESKAVLLLGIALPHTKEGEKKGEELWNNFFANTKVLDEPLYLKAHGEELYPGLTILDIAGVKANVYAERNAAKKVRFLIVPQDEKMTFEYSNAFVMPMPFDWHHDEPLLKIVGTYRINNGNLIVSSTVNVLIKEVDTFSNMPILKKNTFFKLL